MKHENGMVEPDVTINEQPLDFGEAMTLRVAVGSFQMYCASMAEAEPDNGLWIGYLSSCKRIQQKIFANQPRIARDLRG